MYLNRGVFETAHGIGENVRGRTLGAIDSLTKSGSPESTSRNTSMADRGRMEAETGMAHIYGYPDPNAENVSHNEPGRLPKSTTTGTPGNGHTTGTEPGTGVTEDDYRGPGGVRKDTGRETTGYGAGDGSGLPGGHTTKTGPGTGITEDDYRGPGGMGTGRGSNGYGADDGSGRPGGHTTGTKIGTTEGDHHGPSGVGRDTGREASGYGVGDGSGRPGAQNLEQQPAIDRNTEMDPSADPTRPGLSPNRGPPRGASYGAANPPTSQAGTLTPAEQKVERDSPPELPPRPEAQAADNDQRGQINQ